MMPENCGENPQVNTVRKRGRLSPDYHGHSHPVAASDNAQARGFSRLSPHYHLDSQRFSPASVSLDTR
jgi:hypothetical protein